MSHGGPSVMESYQTPSSIATGHSTGHGDYPGESVSGDTTVQGRDYREMSVEYIGGLDSGGGTVVGYISTASHGVPDVDFDDKQAYESIERFQDRRVVAHPQGNGTCPPPSSMPDVHQPGKFDMPDYVTKKGWASLRRCLCFFIILSLVTLVVAVAGAAIGVYAFLSVFEGGRVLGGSTVVEGTTGVQTAAVAMLQNQILESQMLIEELRMNLSQVNTVHQSNYADLSVQLAEIINNPVVQQNTTNNNNNNNDNVSAFDGCVTQAYRTCSVEHNNQLPGTPPFSSCETATVPIDQVGMVTVDVFCAVENRNGERNPIASSLNYFDGEASCLCYLIAAQTTQSDIRCTLYMKRCPAST